MAATQYDGLGPDEVIRMLARAFPRVVPALLSLTIALLPSASDGNAQLPRLRPMLEAADTATADQILAEAKAQAAASHRNVLLVFSASWCGPCHLFEAFLHDPATGPIMDKNFVVARFDVGERPGDKRHADTPGAVALRASLDGANAGYPFLVITNPAGKVIVNSYRPVPGKKPGGDTNVGYPATHEEIDWFMQMLHQSAPGISPAEADTIRHWLQQRGHS